MHNHPPLSDLAGELETFSGQMLWHGQECSDQNPTEFWARIGRTSEISPNPGQIRARDLIIHKDPFASKSHLGSSRGSWQGLAAGARGKGRLRRPEAEPITWVKARDFLPQFGSHLCAENMEASFRKTPVGFQPGPWAFTGGTSKTKPPKGSKTNVFLKRKLTFHQDTPGLCLPGSSKNPPGCPSQSFLLFPEIVWTPLKERI